MTTDPTWRPECVLCSARGRTRRLEAGHVCPECASWLSATLTRIGDLASMATTERVTSAGSSTGKPVFGSKPPLNVEGLDVCDSLVRTTDAPPWPTLLEVVEAWERMVRDMRGLSPYGPASLARGGASLWGCLAFLGSSVEWMTTDTAFPIDDLAEELRACLRAVRKWDTEAPRRGMGIPCPTLKDDGTDCEYPLQFGDGDDEVTCRRCRVTRTPSQLMAVGMATKDHEMWVDAEAITERYGIPKRTLQRMAQRGQVRRNHGRYLLSDIVATRTG